MITCSFDAERSGSFPHALVLSSFPVCILCIGEQDVFIFMCCGTPRVQDICNFICHGGMGAGCIHCTCRAISGAGFMNSFMSWCPCSRIYGLLHLGYPRGAGYMFAHLSRHHPYIGILRKFIHCNSIYIYINYLYTFYIYISWTYFVYGYRYAYTLFCVAHWGDSFKVLPPTVKMDFEGNRMHQTDRTKILGDPHSAHR